MAIFFIARLVKLKIFPSKNIDKQLIFAMNNPKNCVCYLKALSPGPLLGPRPPLSAPLIELLASSSDPRALCVTSHTDIEKATPQHTCLWVHYLVSLDKGCPLYMGRRLLYHHPKTLLLSPHYNSPKETKQTLVSFFAFHNFVHLKQTPF